MKGLQTQQLADKVTFNMDNTSLNFLITTLHTVLVENERLNIPWNEIFTCSLQNSAPNLLKLKGKKGKVIPLQDRCGPEGG